MAFRSSSWFSVLAFLPAFVFSITAISARADDAAPSIALTVASATGGVMHTLANGDSFTRAASLHPEGVSFEDCMLDVQIHVPLTVSNATSGSYPLSVYAGTGCDSFTARQIGGSGATCWPVLGASLPYTEGASYPVTIPVRQIIAQLYSSTKTAYAPVQSNAICYAQPDSSARNVSLYFLLTTTDLSETASVAITSFGVDLAAAAPPARLSVGIGDTLLLPKWSAIVDPDTIGFDVFSYRTSMTAPVKDSTVCDEGGAGDAESDADAAADAGATHCRTVEVFDPTPATDGGNLPYEPSGFACASPFPVDRASDGGIIAGATETVAASTSAVVTNDGGTTAGDAAVVSSDTASIGPIEVQPNETADTFPLTVVAGNVSSATIANLTDYAAYSVAVAATDGYGNVGAFTSSSGEAVCQYPLPVTDFFTSYNDEGGEAGGSFCTMSTSDLPTGAGSSSVVTLVALACAGRRRKRRLS